MTRSLKIGPHSSTGSAMAAMPYPSEFGYIVQPIGGTHNTSASVYRDVFDRRHTWIYRWNMIPSGSLATLKTEFDRNITLDMTPVEVDDSTYYEVVITSGFDVQPTHVGVVGSPRFNLSLTFQET